MWGGSDCSLVRTLLGGLAVVEIRWDSEEIHQLTRNAEESSCRGRVIVQAVGDANSALPVLSNSDDAVTSTLAYCLRL